MTESGYGHAGRIPNYGGRGHMDNRGVAEPPACIQNAMMTKDKKPFTYTPGGLDLSQIKTPSMARRMARQRSQEEEHGYAPHSNSNGYQTTGGVPQPPPPTQAGPPPPPPPPPPLVIETPSGAAAKPQTVIRPVGERPEIVIPENPIGMLRKTNSPYHWEQEEAEKDRMERVPKFVEKNPSPMMQQNFPQSFSQQPPASYTPQVPNNVQRQNIAHGNQQRQLPESPVYKPEPQYPRSIPSPGINQTPTRDTLQRQDSQFNKSPAPFGPQSNSPQTNGSPISPSSNNAWRQQEHRDSPLANFSPQTKSPFSPINNNRSPQFTPTTNASSSPSQKNNSSPIYHTLPRESGRTHESFAQSPPKSVFSNTIYNNVKNEPRTDSPKADTVNPTPWRTNTLPKLRVKNDSSPIQTQNIQNNNNDLHIKQNQLEQTVQPPWVTNHQNDSDPWRKNAHTMRLDQSSENNLWKQQQHQQGQPSVVPQNQSEPRYQSTMSIPITPQRPQHFEQPKPQPQSQTPQHNREAVYVTQEPVYYCNPDSPKASVPLWVRNQKEKTPPPEWVQRPLERKSLPRDIISPLKEPPKSIEPEWVQKSLEMRSGQRELSSPPPTNQTVQANWSTKPSDNRKTMPQHNGLNAPESGTIPIQVYHEASGDKQPQMRIIINMQNPHEQPEIQQPYSGPTQRIMRVLSPQMVSLDQPDFSSRQRELPSLNSQPKTRIIPIQIEGGGNETPNRSVGGRY